MEKSLKICMPCGIGRKLIERRIMMRAKIFVIVYVFVLLAFIPSIAAEKFIDLYFGQNTTNDAEVSAGRYEWFGDQYASEEIDFDPSGLYGLRWKFWSDSIRQIGWAIDIFYFEAESEKVDVSMIPLSVLLMLRLPLFVGDEFPGGILQPYIGLGPSIYFYNIHINFKPEIWERISHYDGEFGWQCHAGLLWQFHKDYGLFAEYRYTTCRMNERWETDEWFSPDYTEEFDVKLDTHHFLVGMSFRF